MKILITGVKGMLGIDLLSALRTQHRVLGVDVEEMDITDRLQVFSIIEELEPELIIHCAAFTDVDGCESQRKSAYLVNAEGTANIALACQHTGCDLMYVSTDFVFDGTARKPYTETDAARPLSRYGQSKRAGELIVSTLLENYLIIRTSWLFGLNGKNFIYSILRQAASNHQLSVVNDQVGSPTYTRDLAEAITHLIPTRSKGIVHIANSGQTSWFEFARTILRLAHLDSVEVIPITSEQLNRPAVRPAYSVLNLERYTQLTGRSMRSWEAALEAFIIEKNNL